MKTLTIIAALLSTTAFATTNVPGTVGNSQQMSSYNSLKTSASSTSTSSALGLGVGVGIGGQGGQGGAATSAAQGGAATAQGGAATGQGGQASVTNNVEGASLTYVAPKQPDNVTIKNTPDVTLSNIMPTAPCMGGSTLGGSGAGVSIAFGTTWKDADCSLRETARSFSGLGLADDAIAILCSSEYAAAAPTCIALKAK